MIQKELMQQVNYFPICYEVNTCFFFKMIDNETIVMIWIGGRPKLMLRGIKAAPFNVDWLQNLVIFLFLFF